MGALADRWEAGFRLSAPVWDAMLADNRRHPQEEACGLLVGGSPDDLKAFPVTNALHSPVRFYMQPEELLAIFTEADERGWEVFAIYHSHLKGPPVPSPTDLAEFRYPGVLTLVWSPGEAGWNCRAFLILENRFREIPIYRI